MTVPAPRPPGLPLQVRRFPGNAELRVSPPWGVIRPQGEIDLATASGFRQAVGEALRAGGDPDAPTLRHYVVDLRQVTFLDSAGISVLALLARDAPARGHSVSLVGASPPVRTLLRITGLLGLVPEQTPAELPAPAQLALG